MAQKKARARAKVKSEPPAPRRPGRPPGARDKVKRGARTGAAKPPSASLAPAEDRPQPLPDLDAVAKLRKASRLEDGTAKEALLTEWSVLHCQLAVLEWRQARGEPIPADEVRAISPLAKRHEEVLERLGVLGFKPKKRPGALGLLGVGGA